jgi:hypothetical protein
VRRDGCPCSWPITRDDVHHARRKPCLKGKKAKQLKQNSVASTFIQIKNSFTFKRIYKAQLVLK